MPGPYNIDITVVPHISAAEDAFKRLQSQFDALKRMGSSLSTDMGLAGAVTALDSLNKGMFSFAAKLQRQIVRVKELTRELENAGKAAKGLSVGGVGSPTGVSGQGMGGAATHLSSGASGAVLQQQRQSTDYLARADKYARRTATGRVVSGAAAYSSEHGDVISEAGAQGVSGSVLEAARRRADADQARVKKLAGEDYLTGSFGMSGRGMQQNAQQAYNAQMMAQMQKKTMADPAMIRAWGEQFKGSLETPVQKAMFHELQRQMITGAEGPRGLRRLFGGSDPFSMMGAAGFMLRYRAMSAGLAGAGWLGHSVLGGSRANLVEPTLSLSSVGFSQSDRLALESAGIRLSSTVPGVTTQKFMTTAAEIASPLDVSKVGVNSIIRATVAASKMAQLSQLSAQQGGKLLSSTYMALADTKQFKGTDPGSAQEHIANVLGAVISRTGAWGPDLQNAFRHMLPAAVAQGWDIERMATTVGMMKTAGMHAGQVGRFERHMLNDKGKKELLQILLAGADGTGLLVPGVPESDAWMRSAGIGKAADAKRLNAGQLRRYYDYVDQRMKSDPYGLLALAGQRFQGARDKGFLPSDMLQSKEWGGPMMLAMRLADAMKDMEASIRGVTKGGSSGAFDQQLAASMTEPGVVFDMFKNSMTNAANALGLLGPFGDTLREAMLSLNKWSDEVTVDAKQRAERQELSKKMQDMGMPPDMLARHFGGDSDGYALGRTGAESESWTSPYAWRRYGRKFMGMSTDRLDAEQYQRNKAFFSDPANDARNKSWADAGPGDVAAGIAGSNIAARALGWLGPKVLGFGGPGAFKVIGGLLGLLGGPAAYEMYKGAAGDNPFSLPSEDALIQDFFKTSPESAKAMFPNYKAPFTATSSLAESMGIVPFPSPDDSFLYGAEQKSSFGGLINLGLDEPSSAQAAPTSGAVSAIEKAGEAIAVALASVASKIQGLNINTSIPSANSPWQWL